MASVQRRQPLSDLDREGRESYRDPNEPLPTACRVLVEARALLATPERWVPGLWGGRLPDGAPAGLRMVLRHCSQLSLGGALMLAAGNAHRACAEAERHLHSLTGVRGLSYQRWEAAGGRTHDQVLELLDRAIATQGGAE